MDDRLGQDALVGAMRRALADASVGEADLYVQHTRRGFARFSLNTLNQHAQTVEPQATARVGIRGTDGWRLATVSTTDLRHDALVAALRRARSIAERVVPLVDWPGFASGPGDPLATPPRYADRTAACTASHRSELLAPALAEARSHGLTAAGALETRSYECALASTAGLARYASGTFATFKMFALDADGVSGFAQSTHRDVDRLDVAARAREACAKSLAGKDPVALPAGEYDVVLEPPAVAELLEWLSFIAFGAREVRDGTSILAGTEGQLVSGSNVTIVDDGNDASDLGFGVPFDRDGVARRRVELVINGRAGRPVYDRLYGARMDHPSTGHASFGDAPVAQALSLAAGDAPSIEALTARLERGLHVTRLHYVNGFLEPRRTLMTGLTRDGTFLVESGQRVRGVRNMRFTENILEAFGRTESMTALREAVPTWWSEAGAFAAPSVLIRGFRFTGAGTEKPAG